MSQVVMTTADRLQYGLIAAALGAVVGALAAVVVLAVFALVGFPHPFNVWLVGFSGAFFFLLGIVRGVKAADIVADSLGATMLVALGTIGIRGDAPVLLGDVRELRWRANLWLTAAYFAGMVLIAWLG